MGVVVRLLGMNLLGTAYYLDLIRAEHAERVKAAQKRRLAATLHTPGPVRRWVGRALIRTGLAVQGRTRPGAPILVPAPHGGLAR